MTTLKSFNIGRAGEPERTGLERPGAGVSAYEKYPYLRAHEAFLGKLELCDIVGEGQNAVIVRHPFDAKVVVKLAKPGEVDGLSQEYANHFEAYIALETAIEAGLASPDVRIPRVFHAPEEREGYFMMELVEGQSLQTKCLIDRFGGRLPEEYRPRLAEMTDGQVRTLVRDKLKMDDDWIIRTFEDYAGDHLHPLLYDRTKPMEKTPVSKTLDVLRDAGVGHGDVHPGNFMIARDGRIYIIDFGRVKRSQ